MIYLLSLARLRLTLRRQTLRTSVSSPTPRRCRRCSQRLDPRPPVLRRPLPAVPRQISPQLRIQRPALQLRRQAMLVILTRRRQDPQRRLRLHRLLILRLHRLMGPQQLPPRRRLPCPARSLLAPRALLHLPNPRP
jgi:hypothetical protein